MTEKMDLLVRPAAPDDPCVPLLFESARPYYTAYAGSEQRALELLHAVYTRPTHAASYDCCTVACVDGELVGVVAGFPVTSGDRLSRRFIQLTLPMLMMEPCLAARMPGATAWAQKNWWRRLVCIRSSQ